MTEFITIQVKGSPFLIPKEKSKILFQREVIFHSQEESTMIVYPDVGVVVVPKKMSELIVLINSENPEYLELLFNIDQFPVFKFLDILIPKQVPPIVRHWEFVAKQKSKKRKSALRWLFPFLFLPK